MLADRARLELSRLRVLEVLVDRVLDVGDVEAGDADLAARRPLRDQLGRGFPVGLIDRAPNGLAAERALDVDRARAASIALRGVNRTSGDDGKSGASSAP